MVLPFDPPDARVKFRPAPLSLVRARSVLLVDDEETVRRGIRRFLEKVGFEVREAWSGRSAHAQITVQSPPELVVTDLKMSDGSGQWFLTELARDFPHLLRKTVIITGETDDLERQRLTCETGCPVMRKPVDLTELVDVLDEVAARELISLRIEYTWGDRRDARRRYILRRPLYKFAIIPAGGPS